MARIKVEVLIDEDLLRWADQQASATGRTRDELLEEAIQRGRLRSLTQIADAVASRADMSDSQAAAVADDEVGAYRREQGDSTRDPPGQLSARRRRQRCPQRRPALPLDRGGCPVMLGHTGKGRA